MKNRGHVSLKERALQAWQNERPRRAEQLLKRVNMAFELRQTIEEVLGHDLPIRIVTDLQDRPVAIIEELRFILANRGEENSKSLMLIDTCLRCYAEAGSLINTLADLGQLLERFGATLNLGCSECVGLTDDELKA